MFLNGYVSDMGRQKLVGPMTDYLAGELRAQKSRRKWTLDEIEARSGIDRSTVERAIKGTHGVAFEVMVVFCEAMELDPRQIVADAMRSRTGKSP